MARAVLEFSAVPLTKRIAPLLLATAVLVQFSSFAADEGDAILGVWRTAEDKSKVEIFKKDGFYCAKIISLKEPNWPADDKEGMGGKPKNDRRNPNPELRKRPIVGIQFMNGFVPAGNKHWDQGKIYDPESGKTYQCKLSLSETNRLEVRGFVGISLLGRTEVWKRP